MQVPWLSKKSIAEIASTVISGYQGSVGHLVKPPIPIDEIIESYLRLRLEYMDFEKMPGIKGVLGAIYVSSRRICFNEKLLDADSEGRLSFTCAHEVGHWILHRDYIEKAERSNQNHDVIICRTKDAKLPIEWQADYFAACLLMPEEWVKESFYLIYGHVPLELHNIMSSFNGPLCFDPCAENWYLIADAVCKAGGFSNVSKQAMIIRLQDLGLLKNLSGAKLGGQKTFFKN